MPESDTFYFVWRQKGSMKSYDYQPLVKYRQIEEAIKAAREMAKCRDGAFAVMRCETIFERQSKRGEVREMTPKKFLDRCEKRTQNCEENRAAKLERKRHQQKAATLG